MVTRLGSRASVLLHSRKGYLYTIEVLLAMAIVFVAVTFAFRAAPPKPELQLPLMKQIGFDALKYLDHSGKLRGYALNSDEKNLEKDLKDVMSKKIKFETEICTQPSTCSERNVPNDKTIAIVDYYITNCINCLSGSSYDKTYSFKRVRLYVWEGD